MAKGVETTALLKNLPKKARLKQKTCLPSGLNDTILPLYLISDISDINHSSSLHLHAGKP
ncbi:hypothetical protein [Desulfogranum mediterraneum]|uniref:hypothetical protein n=1 Tax=Desulfogranum mediterraneum TaxID=160661 RepID=UPI0012947C81|nr:hypothetical protein [Desulfogranum mediterraneum]